MDNFQHLDANYVRTLAKSARSAKALSIKKIKQEDDNIPIPIDRNEKLTRSSSEKGDVKLVQQYIMVAGKLQPALKYLAPNPMYNRY